MMRTKANLRAIRETVGLSQSDLARLADVSVSTVKSWEKPEGFVVPLDVHEMMEEALRQHEEAVQAAVDVALGSFDATNPTRPHVTLPWWRSQAQYDALGRDEGFFGVVNARSRDVARELRRLGFVVDFIAPEARGIEWFGGSL